MDVGLVHFYAEDYEAGDFVTGYGSVGADDILGEGGRWGGEGGGGC